MKRTIVLLFACLVCACRPCAGFDLEDVRYTPEDSVRFCAVAEKMLPYAQEPAQQLIIRVAKEFLGTPYVAGLLEQEPEMLTIDTRHSDCILFVEMCLAITLAVQSDDCSFEHFCQITQSLRYQGGEVDGYASRNHYTSAWILQGESNGLFTEVSRETGGVPRGQHFNFMSTHPDSYKQLAGNPGLVEMIADTEAWLNGFEYYYLPQSNIDNLCKGIRTGDIICFVTPVAGLDIGHVALAYEHNGQMHFIHASSAAKKVIISEETVADYIKTHKSTCGLRVVRLSGE